MSVERVIEIARGELGYTENPPGSNRTKYGEAYGWNGVPWCVQFTWWCFREAGEQQAFFGGEKTASCGTLLRWYQEQGQTVPIHDMRAGDIVILDFSGTRETQHCGLVEHVAYSKEGKAQGFFTVEGNTCAKGAQDNGGIVLLKPRYLWQVVDVCRPRYKEEAMEPKTDYEGHWAEESIRKAISKNVMQGYEDGSWQPDKPMTRAELATILDRLGVLG